MPELPEVETTYRGITPHVVGKTITRLDVLQPSLRIPVPPELQSIVRRKVRSIERRAKYLIFSTTAGKMLIHFGMSGSLRICKPGVDLRKHDHVVFALGPKKELRFHDPRRFGLIDWTTDDIDSHRFLCNLGPEPLTDAFRAEYLASAAFGRKLPIKSLIMTNQVVVGVGNIYACEALFLAGIHPSRPSSKVSSPRLALLTEAIKDRLLLAISRGGTTLRDFVSESGQPGYFKQELNVYGREDEPCRKCGIEVKRIVLGQRSTFFCPHCQR